MDCNLPGFSVHEILQTRKQEWVAICLSNFTTLLRHSWQMKNHTFNIYILMHLDICMYQWYHHHSQGTKHVHHLLKFPVSLCYVCVYVCVKNTQHEIYSLCKFLNACYGLKIYCCYYYSAAKSCPALRLHELQHIRLSLSCSNSQFAQTHVHWVSNAIQPSHPLLSPSRLALNLSKSPVRYIAFSLHCWFPLLCRNFLVWCHPSW